MRHTNHGGAVMDIAGLSMNLATANIQTQYGVAVLGKQLDSAEQTGDALVSMIDSAAMERSVRPNIGGNFDMSV